jgi:hypothetical protein
MIQPPKMSPLGLQSAGIAREREASSPLGSVEFRRLSLERIPPSPGCGYRPSHVALQHKIVKASEKYEASYIAMRKI